MTKPTLSPRGAALPGLIAVVALLAGCATGSAHPAAQKSSQTPAAPDRAYTSAQLQSLPTGLPRLQGLRVSDFKPSATFQEPNSDCTPGDAGSVAGSVSEKDYRPRDSSGGGFDVDLRVYQFETSPDLQGFFQLNDSFLSNCHADITEPADPDTEYKVTAAAIPKPAGATYESANRFLNQDSDYETVLLGEGRVVLEVSVTNYDSNLAQDLTPDDAVTSDIANEFFAKYAALRR